MILKIFVKSKNEQMTLYLLASIKMFKCLLAILMSKTALFLITYTYPTLFYVKFILALATNTSNPLNQNSLTFMLLVFCFYESLWWVASIKAVLLLMRYRCVPRLWSRMRLRGSGHGCTARYVASPNIRCWSIGGYTCHNCLLFWNCFYVIQRSSAKLN